MSHNEFDQTAIAGLYACRDCGAIVADEEGMDHHSRPEPDDDKETHG